MACCFCNIAWSCVVAAVVSIVGDLLALGAFASYRNNAHLHGKWNEYKYLDPQLIMEEWETRRDLRPIETASGLFSAASWVILCIPVVQMIWILGRQGTHLVGLHTSMMILTVSGAIVEITSLVMYVGAVTAMEWLSTDFNLSVWLESSTAADPDDIGWRVLEMIHIGIRGMQLWVGAVELLFLATMLVLLFFSIQRQGDSSSKQYDSAISPNNNAAVSAMTPQPVLLSYRFGYYSLFISLLCIVDFCFEVLRFVSWREFAKFAFGVAILLRLIFWPAWLLWLGRHLGTFQQNQLMYNHGNNAAAPSLMELTDANGNTNVAAANTMMDPVPVTGDGVYSTTTTTPPTNAADNAGGFTTEDI
mmetsp:Transcript_17303/g.40797  ORF Transcript_17303/g.40797 Transcript_17303/m.40797 type:complete len:361 (+) Transcript_17303:92-1174(+)|eukprot:CAMPEP_0168739482 /NCGR_PEP_ID=MMETSP0724-20121128/11486_1 /TAXON_ID=265536 /ORGANISM="Amphiprora sp., Strain CCMP467" /LENGTH=360 /DNA_ID=CAMNT_0008786887 /DNA_START=84 /DNA_END=1166 /DNA_ORIENTATION=-